MNLKLLWLLFLIASNYASAQNEIKENPKLAKYIQIIISQSNKLNQHIEKILTVAKTETKQISIQKKIIDVDSSFELVKDNILLKYHNNIQINFESESKFQILADEFHFYNMVYNILDNAVKYSKSDAVIDVLIKENSKGLLLKFKDNGVGIPENDLPFVFDKFFRVAREDSKDIEGFGIGLSYVKRVCEWHKWKVFVTNNEDKGITVTIQLNKNDYE
uniref:sensor histidine kinase n=1 Tax=Flavobacterium sp. TaxID=239 RepID=UPI0040483D1D